MDKIKIGAYSHLYNIKRPKLTNPSSATQLFQGYYRRLCSHLSNFERHINVVSMELEGVCSQVESLLGVQLALVRGIAISAISSADDVAVGWDVPPGRVVLGPAVPQDNLS